MKLNKILVPTDFSSFADAALEYAVKIAERANAEIILFNVMLTPDNTAISANEGGTNLNLVEDNKYLMDVLEGARSNLKELIAAQSYQNIRYQISSGSISKAIMEYVKSESIDLVVMGTQGESGYDALLVGSNAEKMVRLTPCPVLTVRHSPQDHKLDFEHLVFGSDLDLRFENTIKELKAFQALFNSKLHIVFVNTQGHFFPSHKVEQKVKDFVEAHSLSNYEFHLYCDYTEEEGITHFAESLSADAIIVASHKRRGFSRLLAGSISEGVVNVSQIPVLTLSLG